MIEWIHSRLVDWGMAPDTATFTVNALDIAGLALTAFVAYHVAQKSLVRLIQRVASKTRTHWDDRLVEKKAFRRFAHVVPAIVIYSLAPLAVTSEAVVLWARRGAEIYILVAVLATANVVLSVGLDIYNTYEIARRFPIQVYVQVVRILLVATALIVAISIVTGQSPVLLLSGLGAMTAILLLISKDSIQGLVAGVQLVSNDMVRVGDWIEMPQYGADGDVIAITLHTVKVQNWDKTISMIPTYSLVAGSFKNWRGMAESGGRRIKRSIYLDISSVRFCDAEMIARFKEIELLREYIGRKEAELVEYNRNHEVTESMPVNGRRMTNVGMFRQYLVGYLRTHPMINEELTLIVRQLQPSEHGLPLELYAFSANKEWVAYEGIQSDIFDHIFAALPNFGLRAFQAPSGEDAVRALAPLRN